MPNSDNLIISGGGGKPGPKKKIAWAKTLAGKYRQVWEGKAELTSSGGLKKSQLTKNSTGKIVSKKKSNKPIGEFIKKSRAAAKRGDDSITYKGETYYRHTTGHLYYKKRGGSSKRRKSSGKRRKSSGKRRKSPASAARAPASAARVSASAAASPRGARRRRRGCRGHHRDAASVVPTPAKVL